MDELTVRADKLVHWLLLPLLTTRAHCVARYTYTTQTHTQLCWSTYALPFNLCALWDKNKQANKNKWRNCLNETGID